VVNISLTFERHDAEIAHSELLEKLIGYNLCVGKRFPYRHGVSTLQKIFHSLKDKKMTTSIATPGQRRSAACEEQNTG
jgi:hypothetical protein